MLKNLVIYYSGLGILFYLKKYFLINNFFEEFF